MLYEMHISNNMRCTSRAGKDIGLDVLPNSLATDKYLSFVCQGSGKEIRISSFGQFQPFAQFGNGGGKVAYGEVRLFSAASISFTSFLLKPQEEEIRNLRPGKSGRRLSEV